MRVTSNLLFFIFIYTTIFNLVMHADINNSVLLFSSDTRSSGINLDQENSNGINNSVS